MDDLELGGEAAVCMESPPYHQQQASGEDWGLVPGRKVEQEESLDGFSEQGSKLE